jgi:hypothetical protein
MKIDLRNAYLSGPRYNRYLTAAGNDLAKAKKLYTANIRLAQAFHPLLSQFEVVFRNSLNSVLSAYFNDQDWIITQKAGFMRHPSLRRSNFFLKTSIEKTEAGIIRRGITATSGRIIADQTFGFWLAFFLPHHYSLVNGQPLHLFACKPRSENRASIYDKLDKIKNFRNRVNHCEPVCFAGHHMDCTHALDIRAKIYDLINWIEPTLVPFFENLDNIPGKINRIANI